VSNASALARYQEVDVLTMPAGRRLVLLYGHLVLALRQGRVAIVAGDIAGRSARVVKALDILHELLFSLDREAGGKMADDLAALYAHLIAEIGAVDRRPDAARLDRVIEITATLHEAWASAARSTEQG
jgi:flagellar secretion chaperone FliS